MNLINRYIFSFLVTIFSSLIIFLFLIVFFHTFYGLTDVSIMSGYISGIGSFFGGIVGGIVAFYVTKIQLNNIKEKELISAKQKYYNILTLLQNELEHNNSILFKINSLEQINKKDYAHLLEDEVWKVFRFDANNHMPRDTFHLLSILYREIRDMRNDTIEYDKISISDITTRIKTIQLINSKINSHLENHDKEAKNKVNV